MEEGKGKPKVSKIKLLDREERVDILKDAAKVGQLTRLNEHVVEQVAGPIEEEEEIEFGRSATESAVGTSNFLVAIQEAAEMGKMRRLKPVEIENFKEREKSNVEMFIRKRDMSRISRFLEQEKQRKIVETPMERAERIREAMENVNMLSPTPIKAPRNIRRNVPLRMREDVAKLAAKESTDRMARIGDVEKELKITFQCACPHCKNASPFQTSFYSKMDKERLQRVKSQRVGLGSPKPTKLKPVLDIVEEDEIVDEKVAKLRKQVDASIKLDEERRKAELQKQATADKHANIQAAKAALEKTLFQPKAKSEVVKEEHSKAPTLDDIDPEVLYSDTFGLAATRLSRRDIHEVVDEDEQYRIELEEQVAEEDLRQLTELYDRQDAGEKVNGERIYELELFDRDRRDGYFSEREKKDLDIYRKRRIRTDRFIEEYEDVMGHYNMGAVIDEHRAYQLEYVVKKRGLSQDLSMNELSAMILFETEEYVKDGLDPADFRTSYTEEPLDASGVGESSTKEADPELDGVSQASVPPESLVEGVEMAQSDEVAISVSQSPVSLKSLHERVELTKADEVAISVSQSPVSLKSLHEEVELTKADEVAISVSQSPVSLKSLHEGVELTKADEVAISVSQSPVSLKSLHERVELTKADETVISVSQSPVSVLLSERDENAKVDEPEIGNEMPDATESSDGTGSSQTDSEYDSSLSSFEIDELETLMDLKENGEDVDQSRLRDLDLFDKWRFGEELGKEDMHHVNAFRSQRRIERGYRKEFETLLELQERGRKVDQDRFYHLQLYARRQVGEDMSKDELLALEDFEREEEINASRHLKQNCNTSNVNGVTIPFTKELDHEQLGDQERDAREGVQTDDFDHVLNANMFLAEESIGTLAGNVAAQSVSEQKRNDSKGMTSKLETTKSGTSKAFGSTDSFLENFAGFSEVDFVRTPANEMTGESSSNVKVSDFQGEAWPSEEKETFPSEQWGGAFDSGNAGSGQNDVPQVVISTTTKDCDGDLSEVMRSTTAGVKETSEVALHMARQELDGGDDDSFLSLEEVEELQQLLKYKARGHKVDEEHLSQLQVLDRWQKRRDLSDEEKKELEVSRKQRRKARRYMTEFQDLLERTDRGESVDEERIYFLQLYARRHLGEDLTAEDMIDLEEFEAEEMAISEDEQEKEPAAACGVEMVGSNLPRNSDSVTSIAEEQGSVDRNVLSFSGEDGEESFLSAGEIVELEELLGHQANGEDIDDRRLNNLQLVYRWQNGDSLNEDESRVLAQLRQQRRKDRYYKNEFKVLLARTGRGEEVSEERICFLQLYARRLLGEYLSFEELLDLEEFEKKENLSFQKEDKLTQEFGATGEQAFPASVNGPSSDMTLLDKAALLVDDGGNMASENIAVAVEDKAPGLKGSRHQGTPQDDNIFVATLHSKGEVLPSSSSTSSETREESVQNHSQVESGSSNDAADQPRNPIHGKPEGSVCVEEASFLSEAEVNELGKLFEAEARGDDFDLERLRRLELIGRWQRGEDLDSNEQKKIAVLREDRRMYRRMKLLLEELLVRRHHKEEDIPDDDLYFLQLYVRRFSGKELLFHEISDLEEFERGEKAQAILEQYPGIVAESECKAHDECGGISSGTSMSDEEVTKFETTSTATSIHAEADLNAGLCAAEGESESNAALSPSLLEMQSQQPSLSQLQPAPPEETSQHSVNASLHQIHVNIKHLAKPDLTESKGENSSFGVSKHEIEAHYETPRNEIRASLLHFQSEMQASQKPWHRPHHPQRQSGASAQRASQAMLFPLESEGNGPVPYIGPTKGQGQDGTNILNQPSFSSSIRVTESTDSYGFNEVAKEAERDSQDGKVNSQLHSDTIAEAELVKQLQAAKDAARAAEARALQEAAKRVAAEESAKRAEVEAREAKNTVAAVKLAKEMWRQTREDTAKRVVTNEHEKSRINQLATVEETVEDIGVDCNISVGTRVGKRQKVAKEQSLETDRVGTKGGAELRKNKEAKDYDQRAQERKERARKAVEERKRRAEEHAEVFSPQDKAGEARRERTRKAVEERKRKAREAMEARKAKTEVKAMEKMKSSKEGSVMGEAGAVVAAKLAGQMLKIQQEEAATKSRVSRVRIVTPPRTELDPLIQGIRQRASEVVIRVEMNDPPVHSSDDPPGIQYDPPIKVSPGNTHLKQRDTPIGDQEMIEVIVVQKSINGDHTSTSYHTAGGDKKGDDKDGGKDDDITHEDWYAKMQKIAMSQTYAEELGGGSSNLERRVMSPNDWYMEIEALARSVTCESADEDEDMKRAIDEAKRNAKEANLGVSSEIDKEMKEEIEEIRREVRKMTKSEAVSQILQKVSSDSKSQSKLDPNDAQSKGGSSTYPDLPSVPADDIAYSIASLSEDTLASGDFELRSQQTSDQNQQEAFLDMSNVASGTSGSSQISKSSQSAKRSMSKSSPAHRKEKNLLAKHSAPKRNPVVKKRNPNRMQNICWRTNPTDSFSDWRVEITRKETGKTDIYNLHRNVLGYGVRKSGYFLKQFQEDRVVNGYYGTKSPQVTKLDLPEAWAKLFPLVLDFLYYNKDKQCKLTAERACALFKWAEFLEIPALMNTIVEFYAKRLSLKNFDRFMTSAVQMKSGRLVVAAKSKIGSLVTAQPQQAWRIAPQFLSSVLEVNRKELIAKARLKDPRIKPQAFQQASFRWSKAVHTCVKKNKREAKRRLFEELTTETTLPAIDPSVALQLLIMDADFRGDSVYSSFQKRCVQSILDNWEIFRGRYPSQDKMTTALQKLPSDVLAEILILSNRTKSNPQMAM